MGRTANRGFALISVLTMVMVLVVLLAAYFVLTNVEINTTAAQSASTSGFYSAEAGLNLRGDQVLQIFLEENIPAGSSPGGAVPCTSGFMGSGDFACQTDVLNNRQVISYVVEDPGNAAGGTLRRIPNNELFAGLNAIENRYSVFSRAEFQGRTEALLEMIFRSRVVPIFQFAALYNTDLEIAPGAAMTLNGRVHANGDLYLNTSASLRIEGQVTVANRPGGGSTTLYRGRKNVNECETGAVTVDDLDPGTNQSDSPERLNCIGSGRTAFSQSTLDNWNGQIQTGLDTLTVPPLRSFEIGGEYWNYADLRVVLMLNSSGNPTGIEVRDQNNNNISGLTNLVNNTCAGGSAPPHRQTPYGSVRPVEHSDTFYNWRENSRIRMLEVDVQALLNCMHTHRAQFFSSGSIDDTTQGGLVMFFSVVGPNSGGFNNYGVRLRNGANLAASVSGAPPIRGLTVVSDQAVYTMGDYNRNANWRPASIITDSLNILSNSFNTTGGWAYADRRSHQSLGHHDRVALATEVNAAFLSGTDSTGGTEGSGGQGGAYNGGLENYPRLHESWSGVNLTYRGSFVSFNVPQHVRSAWCGTGGAGRTFDPNNNTISGAAGCNIYNPPNRVWQYDTRFNDINQLPPLSPNFVYLRQELFMREFEQQ